MAKEDHECRRGNPAAVALFCGAALFILYLVSPIPVAFAVNHSGHPGRFPPVVRKIYGPFGWAATHTFLRGPIDKYGRFLNRV